MDLDTNINNLPADMISIKLQQNNLKIEGKGTIFIKDEKTLALKLFVINSENFDPFHYFNKLLSQKAGKIVDDDIYFKFKGESLKDDSYICDRVVLVDSISSEIVTGELKDYLFISSDHDFKEFQIGKIIVPHEISIPNNKVLEINRKYSDKWTTSSIAAKLFETNVDGIDIDILNEHDKTIIFFQSKTKCFSDLNDIYPMVDALGFLSSTIVDIYDVELASHNNGITKRILCPSFLKHIIN